MTSPTTANYPSAHGTVASAPPGGPSFPPPMPHDVPPPPKPGRKRWPVAAALVALAVIAAIATVIAIRFTGSDADPASPRRDAMPDEIEHKFDLGPEYDRYLISGEFGRMNVILDGAVVQYDENGDVRWSQDLPRDWAAWLVPVTAGLIPVELMNLESATKKLIFLDADTGAIIDAEVALPEQKRLYYQLGHLYVESYDEVVLYDLDTGEPQATLEDLEGQARFDAWSGLWLVLNDDSESVFDLDLQPILSNVPTGDSYASYDDGKVITGQGGHVVGYDEDGEVFSTPVELDNLRAVLPLTGDRAVLVSDETVQLVSGIGGDSVEVLWSADNDSPRLERVSEERFLVSLEVDDGVWRSVLIDADGNELYESAESGAWLLDNGMLFGGRDNPDKELVFVDLDGTVLWTLPDATLGTVELADNVIVDTETNRVYGPA